MKKGGILITIIITAFLLIGCAPKGKTAEPKIDSKKKIAFFHYFSGTLSGGVESMVEEYNKNSIDYDLAAVPLDHEAFKTKINEALESETPPDIYSYWAGSRVAAILDKLQPLDDIWEKEKLDNLFAKSVIDSACTYNGKKYLLPITQHYVAFFYNKEIFKRCGVEPPKTWNDFKEVCSKLKKGGVIPIALGAKQKWPAQFWFDYILLRSVPSEYRERLMRGEVKYTDTEVKHAMKLWRELIKNGYFNAEPNSVDWDTGANEMVFSGKAAMTLMGTWIIGQYGDADHKWEQGKDYDYFSFPVINEKIPMVSLGPIDGLVIPKQSQNVEGAKNVLYYLSGVEKQKAMSRGSGALSPNIVIPKSFYSEMQQRILEEIKINPVWAFNYDLATPPAFAEKGLNMFNAFLEFPDEYEVILEKLEKEVNTLRSSEIK